MLDLFRDTLYKKLMPSVGLVTGLLIVLFLTGETSGFISYSYAQTVGTVSCKKGGQVVPDADCLKYVAGAKPGPSCQACQGCSGDWCGGSSGSGSGSSSGTYYDWDGDGIGDTTYPCSGCDQVEYGTTEAFLDPEFGVGQTIYQNQTGGSSSSSSSSSGSSGGTVSVICTHFYRRGRMSRELWRNDLEFTFNNLPWTTVRGYQLWGIPAVYLMRKYPWTEAIFYPLAINRAEEIAYQTGLRDKPNYKGKLVRFILEPLCFLIGVLIPEQNWEKVHADMPEERKI